MKRINALQKIAEYLLDTMSGSEKLDILLTYWFIYENHKDILADDLLKMLENNFPEDMYEYNEIFNPVVKLGLADEYNIFNNKYLETIYHDFMNDNISIHDENIIQHAICPCCKFHTLNIEDSFYDICPICKWENDGSELLNYSNVNRSSLFDYRQKFFSENNIEDLKNLYIYSVSS